MQTGTCQMDHGNHYTHTVKNNRQAVGCNKHCGWWTKPATCGKECVQEQYTLSDSAAKQGCGLLCKQWKNILMMQW